MRFISDVRSHVVSLSAKNPPDDIRNVRYFIHQYLQQAPPPPPPPPPEAASEVPSVKVEAAPSGEVTEEDVDMTCTTDGVDFTTD